MIYQFSKQAQIGLAKIKNSCFIASLVEPTRLRRGEHSSWCLRCAQTRWKASARPSIAHDDDHLYTHEMAANCHLNQRLRPIIPPSQKERTTESLQKLERPLDFHEKSPTTKEYTGGTILPLTSMLRIVKPGDEIPHPKWPVFRVMVRIIASEEVLFSHQETWLNHTERGWHA